MIQYTCPTCDRTFTVARREDAPVRPFCSERCKLIDLGKWLNGEYVISDPLIPPPPDAPADDEPTE